MSRVLVTGASGFVGRRLVPALLEAGHAVVAATRYPVGLTGGGVQTVSLDINDREAFATLPTEIDTIIHAAAERPNSQSGSAGVAAAIRTNSLGTLNILAYAEACNIKKVVYCSTVSVYTLPQPVPIREGGLVYPVQTLDSYYGISKLGGELLCERHRRERRLVCLCLRLGRIYGPGERDESLLSRWVQNAKQQQDIVVYGNGERSLDFIYLDDAVRGIIVAIESDWEGGVLNLGSGIETTWRTLAETIVEVFSPPEHPSIVRYMSEGDRARCCLDITLAKAILGFVPRYTLKDGLLAWRDAEIKHGDPQQSYPTQKKVVA